MPYDIKDSSGKVVATFDSSPTQQDLEDLDTHLQGKGQAASSPKTGLGGMSPDEMNAIPSYHPGRLKTGQSAGSLDAVPEWKQVAMKGVNSLPEIGQAVGTAAGMASTVNSGGAAAPIIPMGAAAGRVAGKTLASPLQSLLLPESTPETITPSTILSEGAKGATGGALDAIIPALGSKLAGVTPSAALDTAIEGTNPMNAVKGMARTATGNRPQKIQSRLLKVPYSDASNPTEETKIVNATLKHGIEPTESGYNEVVKKVHDLSGKVDEIIRQATDAGGMVDRNTVIRNLQGLRNQYAKADMPGFAEALDGYVEGFVVQHPGARIPIQDAHNLKKFIYATNEGNYGANTYDPIIESRKKVGDGLRKEIERVANNPELSETNSQLGELLGIRDTIGRAAGRIGRRNPVGLPAEVAANVAAHGTPGTMAAGTAMAAANNPYVMSKVAKGLYGAQQWAGPSPKTPTNISNIGSPTKYIEDFLGFKDAVPENIPAVIGKQGATRGEPYSNYDPNFVMGGESPGMKTRELPSPQRPLLPGSDIPNKYQVSNAPKRSFSEGASDITLPSEQEGITGKLKIMLDDALNTPAFNRTAEQKAFINAMQRTGVSPYANLSKLLGVK